MNKVFKVIFNKSTGTFTAVSEFAKAEGKSSATTVDQSAEISSYTHKAYSLMATAFGAVLLNVPFIAGGALLPVSEAVAAVCTMPGVTATSSANNSLACGPSASTASFINSVAIGSNARATSDESTAIGTNALSNGSGNFAAGFNASASGAWSVAVGGQSRAIDGGSTVHGYAAVASADSTAIGGWATAGYNPTRNAAGVVTNLGDKTGGQSVALGYKAMASGDQSLAIGGDTRATGGASIAIGGDDLDSVSRYNLGNTYATEINGGSLNAEFKRISGVDLVDTTNNNTRYPATRASGQGAVAVGVQAVSSGHLSTSFGTSALASGNSATALGVASEASGRGAFAGAPGSKAIGETSIALGAVALANQANAIALGELTKATARNAMAIGQQANATQLNSAAIGSEALATAPGAMAVGFNAKSQAENGVAFGVRANVTDTGVKGVAIGEDSTSSNEKSIAIGAASKSSGDKSIAIGDSANATNTHSFAIGGQSFSNGTNAMAIGSNAKSTGNFAVALGNAANATSLHSFASGVEANATANYATAVGSRANALAVNSFAGGREATASGNQAVALGNKANATGGSAVAIGNEAEASKNNAVATGWRAKATGDNAVALGREAKAESLMSLALGNNAVANLDRSVALGAYSTVSGAVQTNSATVGDITYSGFAGSTPATGDVVSVGEAAGRKRQIQNVAAGQISATSTDAINGSQLYATNSVLSTLAKSVKTEFGGNAALNPNTGEITFSNIGNTGKDTIHDAIAAVKENVVAGTNIVSVTSQADSTTGATTYTVNAKGTTASSANQNYVTVTPGQPNGENITDYAVDLSDAAKASLAKADTAVQNITSRDNSVVVTKDPNDPNTTNLQVNRDSSITLDSAGRLGVAKTTLVQNNTSMKFAAPRGQVEKFVNAGDLADHLNKAGFKLAVGNLEGGVSSDTASDEEAKRIRTGDVLTMTAGKGMNIKQVDDGYEFAVDSAEVGVAGNKANVPAGSDNKMATVGSVAKAINESGFTLKTSANGGELLTGSGDEVINPADTVDMAAGKNLTVQQGENGKITYATKNEVEFDKVTTTNLAVNNGGTVDMGGNTVTNVGSGGTTNTNAANIGDVKKAKTEVVEGNNVKVSSEKGTDGQTIYTINANHTTANSISPDYISVNGKETTPNTTNYEIGLTTKAITDFTKDTQATVVSTDNTVTVKSTEKNANGTIVYDLSVNTSVPTTELTTNKGEVVQPTETNSYVTAGNLATTINNAVASAKEVVEKGTNIVSVESKVDDATGATTYTVNAKGTTASAGSDKVTVTPTAKDGNITDYAVDLSQTAKDSLAKADTAVQNFKTSVNGNPVQTVANGDTVNFVNGTGTTASNNGNSITFNVNKAALTTNDAGTVTNNNTGDTFVTGDDVVKAINEATARTEKTTSVVAGSNTHVQSKETGNNTEYTVSADKATVSTSAALKLTKVASAPDANQAVTTDYNIDLSDDTKAQIAKEESVVQGDNVTVTEDGTNSTGGKKFKVALNKNLDLGNTGSVTMGNTMVSNDGITINDGSSPVSLTNNGLNNGGNTITNVAKGENPTDAVNVQQLKDAQTKVEKGTNIVSVESKVDDTTGATTYTVNAKGTTASVADGDTYLSVTPSEKDNNVTDYQIGLSQSTKDSLGKADTAMQSFTTAVKGATVDTINQQNTVINFVDGVGTTATIKDNDITFDVNKAKLSTDTTGNVTSDKTGDNFVTGEDVANAINEAAKLTEKTTTVVKGSNTHVQEKVNGNNTEYTVSADKATVSVSEALKMQATPTTDGTTEAVTTDYALDLSDKTKEDIKKGVDAKEAVDNKGLTFTGDSGSTNVEKLGSTVAVNGDTNIATSAAGDAITIKLKDDITVNSVTANNTTTNNLTVKPNGNVDMGGNQITNVASGGDVDTNAANIGDVKTAVAAAKEKVIAGTNVASVVEGTEDGRTTFTVNVKGTTASSANEDYVTVKAGTPNGENVTDYAVDLSEKAKESLSKADTAVQNFKVAVNGAEIQTVSDGQTVKFVDGTGTTARADSENITFDVNKAKLSTDTTGNVTSDKTGDNFVTGEDVANAINEAAKLTEKTTTVVKGSNTHVQEKVDGNNTEYTVSADKATVSVSSALSMNTSDTTDDKEAVTTNYALDLSQTTKDDIKKGVDAKTTVDNEGLTFTADTNSTTEKLLGSSVAINGDENITTEATDNAIAIKLKKDIKVNSVTAQTVNAGDVNATTVKAGDNVLNGDTITVNGNTVTNVNEAINKTAEQAFNPLTFAGDSGTEFERKLGQKVNVKGGADEAKLSDNNIGVVANGADTLEVKLSKELKELNSAEFKDPAGNTTVLNGAGTTITPANGNPVSLTTTGLNNGGNQITNVASGGDVDTNGANISDVKKAKTEVVKGTNIVEVKKTLGNNGQDIYTIDAKDTTATHAESSKDFLTVSEAQDKGNNVKNFETKLTERATTALTAAETAVQAFTTAVNGATVDTINKQNTVINFVDGTGTTARNAGGEITFDVNKADLTTDDKGNVTNTKGGDTFVTGDDVVDAIQKSGFNVKSGGIKADGDDGTSTLINPGEEIEFAAGKNLKVKRQGNVFTYETADVVTFTDVTSDNITVNNGGNLTVGAGSTIDMGNNQITNVASGGNVNTNAANIGDVKAAKTEVAAGTNIVDVVKTTGTNGQDIYTVNAKGTTASVAQGDQYLAVTPSDKGNNVTDYQFGLTQTAKDSLFKADTAVQTLTTSVNGTPVETLNSENTDIGFVNGNVTTAAANGRDITFDVNFDDKTLKQDGNKLAANTTTLTPSETDGTVTAGNADNLATAGDIANAINKAGFKLTATKSAGEVEGTSEELVNPGEIVTIDAGKNIKLTQAAGKITVATKDDVEFNNVTVSGDVTAGDTVLNKDGVKNGDTVLNKDGVKNGDTSLTKDGITIDNGTAGEPVTLTKDGLNNGGNKVTNVADGEISSTSKDAVNGSQLNDIIEKGFKITADQGNEDTVKLGQTVAYRSASGNIVTKVSDNNIDFDLADKIVVGKEAANPVTVDGTTGTVTGLTNKTWNPANITSGQAATEDQLKQVSDVANAGWNLTANGANSSNVAATETVDLNNTDGNIDISKKADEDKVTFNLAKNIKVDSVTAGDTTVNNDGVTINNGNTDNKPVSLTKDGLDNGGNKVTNVADGTENSDAVNLSQLKASQEDVTSRDKTVTIDKTGKTADGATVFDLSVNTDETTITKDADGKVKAKTTTLTPSETEGTVTAGNPDNLATAGDIANAINKAGFKLTATASEGEVAGTSEELVNAGETVTVDAGKNIKLTQAAGKITVATKDDVEFKNVNVTGNVTAGDTTVSNDGVKVGDTTLTKAPITVNGNTVNNVNDAINQTAAQAFSPLTFAGDSGNNVERKLGTTLNVKGGATGTLTDNNIAVVANGTDTLDIKLAEKVDLGTNGEVKAGDTTVNNDGVKVGDNVALSSDGLKAGDVSVTTNGLDNGGNQIKNVAAGTEGTDGVNVSQLDKAAKAAKTEVVSYDESIKVVEEEGENGQTIYDLSISTDDTTIETDGNGKLRVMTTELKPETKAGSNEPTGKVAVPTGADAEKLVNAEDIANAINNSGFNVKSGGNKADGDEAEAELVTAGEEVEFNAGKNLKVKRTGQVFTFETADDVAFNNITLAGSITAGDTVFNKDGIIINNGTAGNPVKVTKDGLDNGGNQIKNVAAGTEATDGVNVSQLDKAAKAAKTEVVSYDESIKVVEEEGENGQTIYDLSVSTDDTTIETDGNGKLRVMTTELKPETNAGSNEPTGKVAVPTGADAEKLVNAEDIANAINKAGFKLTATASEGEVTGTSEELVNAGETVTVDAGKNIKLTQAAGKITVATKDDVEFKNVNVTGNVTAGDTTVNNDGVKVGDTTLTKAPITVNGNTVNNVNDAINQTAAQAFSPLTFAGDSGNNVERKLGTTLNVKGGATGTLTDNNIAVVANGTDTLDIKLAEKVDLGTNGEVKAGDTTVNNDGVKVGDNVALNSDGLKAGDVSVTTNGLDNGGNQIKNVAAGTEDTDGVNVSQLKAAQAAATTKVVEGENMVVTSATHADGSTTYTVATAKDVKFDSVTTGNTVMNNDGVKVGDNVALNSDGLKAGDVSVTTNGLNNGGNQIKNVAAGTEDTDGVNVSQLKAAQAAATTKVEGSEGVEVAPPTTNDDGSKTYTVKAKTDGTTIKVENGNISANTTQLGNNDKGVVNTPAQPNALATAGDIANAINKAGFTTKANGDAGELINPGDEVEFINGSNINITREGGKFTVATAKDVKFDSVQFGDIGPKITNNDGNINVSGNDGSPTKITGVKAGIAATDAVNVSQLNTQIAASKEEVKSDDKSVTVTTTQNAAGANVFDVSVNVDGTTITKDAATGAIKANTANLTDADNDGRVDAPTNGDENKLITAGEVANAVNNVSWNVGSDKDDTTANAATKNTYTAGNNKVKAGDTVKVNAGRNVEISGSGRNINVAVSDNPEFASVKTGDTTVSNDGVTINNGNAGQSVSLSKNGLNNGGNRITNVKAGEANTDAVNVGQLKGVANQLNNKINRNNREARAGIAGSNAAAALPQVYIPGKSMVAAAGGTFKGENALAVGYSRSSDNGKLILKLQGNANSRGDVGGGVGIGYQW